MADAKIQLIIGEMQLSGEGDSKWLEAQIDKLLKLAQSPPVHPKHKEKEKSEGGGSTSTGGNAGQTLAAFLREKNATSNQVRKFLATAIWLHDAKKKDRMKSGDIAKALADARQNRLGNPSDCLNQNVSKGHCEKSGGEFFVTSEGRAELGV